MGGDGTASHTQYFYKESPHRIVRAMATLSRLDVMPEIVELYVQSRLTLRLLFNHIIRLYHSL